MHLHKQIKTSQLFPGSPFPGPLCVKKTIFTPHQMDTQKRGKQALDSTILYFPGHLPLWKSLVWVFLFLIYQNRHFATELSFPPRCGKSGDTILTNCKKEAKHALQSFGVGDGKCVLLYLEN